MASEYKEFSKLLKSKGIRIEVLRSAHIGLYRGNTRIYTMGGSPKNAYEAIQNAIRDLVLAKQLPNNTIYRGRIYKRKRSAKRLNDL